MITVILVIHLFIAIAMVISVLLQRSEGGALGMGGGSGGLMTARGSASLMTRITAVLAGCFMTTSIVLAILAGSAQPRRSIMEQPAAQEAPAQPPPAPSVPLAR